MLHLENRSDYAWNVMIGGFTQLSKLTQGRLKVYDLEGDATVARRVATGRCRPLWQRHLQKMLRRL